MSVTFFIESEATGMFTFDCYEDGVSGKTTHGPFPSYDEALLAITAHKMTCVSCDVYGCYANSVMDVTDEFDVNMANSNAATVLTLLGLHDDDSMCGSMNAAEFARLVSAAYAVQQAVGSNTAVPSTVTREPGHATVVDCGLPENYMLDRLDQLAVLADAATAAGRRILWG